MASREGERSQAPVARGDWGNRLDLGLAADGQRRQKQVGGFRTKKDAQAALNDALAGVQRVTYVVVASDRRRVPRALDRPGG